MQREKDIQGNLEKEKPGVLTLPDIKIYYKVRVIRTVCS